MIPAILFILGFLAAFAGVALATFGITRRRADGCMAL
jgi:hypothetical protein